MEEIKIGIRRMGVKLPEKGREWRMTGLLEADDLVLCGKSEEGLRDVGRFIEVCKRI